MPILTPRASRVERCTTVCLQSTVGAVNFFMSSKALLRFPPRKHAACLEIVAFFPISNLPAEGAARSGGWGSGGKWTGRTSRVAKGRGVFQSFKLVLRWTPRSCSTGGSPSGMSKAWTIRAGHETYTRRNEREKRCVWAQLA